MITAEHRRGKVALKPGATLAIPRVQGAVEAGVGEAPSGSSSSIDSSGGGGSGGADTSSITYIVHGNISAWAARSFMYSIRFTLYLLHVRIEHHLRVRGEVCRVAVAVRPDPLHLL